MSNGGVDDRGYHDHGIKIKAKKMKVKVYKTLAYGEAQERVGK
eukprot:CAMPEP_0201735238 /NCGR_PEP_ID=MMETSP0593-20130828/36542_1 /ASSEMBLY_ACC=CAM_ASM_000672 /TAXON_ID=267983 /ORGANISM="Skeletonema japonicum, Strain CCMP2506" /LENGTH=42 /DNA_ID= /DNA_START= /DNA_END= /DNA_ORIENTATION=